MPDSIQLKIARLEYQGEPDDTRSLVRILPEMEEIREESMLPIWPSFFKDEIFVGKRGDLVWVICNEDFTTGFILGQASETVWNGSYESSSISNRRFEAFSTILVNLRGRVLNYVNLKVTFWNEDSIHFIDRKDGSHLIVFLSGAIHIISPTEILSAVGTSQLIITANEIVLDSETIRLAGAVRMGDNIKGRVLITQGDGAKNALTSSNVWA